jgi:hypothetical protein
MLSNIHESDTTRSLTGILSVKHLVNGMCGVCDLQCAKSDLTYSKISKVFIKVLLINIAHA